MTELLKLKEFCQNVVCLPVTFNSCTKLLEDETREISYAFSKFPEKKLDVVSKSLVSRILFGHIQPKKTFQEFYKYLYEDNNCNLRLIDILGELSKNKKTLFVLIIDGYNRVIENSCLTFTVPNSDRLVGQEFLNILADLILSALDECDSFFLVNLFSGTMDKGFKDIFCGSFPPTKKIEVPLLEMMDVEQIVNELSRKNVALQKNKETWNFKRLLSLVGGHARSLEILLAKFTEKASSSAFVLNDCFNDFFKGILFQLSGLYPNQYYDGMDANLILSYYLTRNVLKTKTQKETLQFDTYQQLGILSLCPISGGEIVDLIYVWFKVLSRSCKDQTMQLLCERLCDIYEKDMTGFDFQNFTAVYLSARFSSLSLISDCGKVSISQVFSGAYIPTDGSIIESGICRDTLVIPYRADCIKVCELKTKLPTHLGKILDRKGKEVVLKHGTVYLNGASAQYADLLCFLGKVSVQDSIDDDDDDYEEDGYPSDNVDDNSIEISIQDKFTINPLEESMDLPKEFEKVKEKHPNAQFVFITNHKVKVNETLTLQGRHPFKDTILISYDQLMSFFGSAFAPKFTMNANHKLMLGEAPYEELLKIPNIGDTTAKKIVAKRIQTMNDLMAEIGETKYKITKEFLKE